MSYRPFNRLDFLAGNVRTWPGPEILAINLIAENQPLDSTWHEKFRCNRHGQLMADSTQWGTRRIAAIAKLLGSMNDGFRALDRAHTTGHNQP